jgi:hypothetical protein
MRHHHITTSSHGLQNHAMCPKQRRLETDAPVASGWPLTLDQLVELLADAAAGAPLLAGRRRRGRVRQRLASHRRQVSTSRPKD